MFPPLIARNHHVCEHPSPQLSTRVIRDHFRDERVGLRVGRRIYAHDLTSKGLGRIRSDRDVGAQAGLQICQLRFLEAYRYVEIVAVKGDYGSRWRNERSSGEEFL